jgi:replicative DNA helicase
MPETLPQESGLTTGVPELDEITYGIRNQELVILAGRPGMGKSALLADVALHVSTGGVPLIFSMEMGYQQLGERLLTNLAGVSYSRAKRNQLQDHEQRILGEAADELSRREILIEGGSLLTPEKMEASLQEAFSDYNISCVFIDHLHYMRLREIGMLGSTEEITRLTKYLKAFAREYNVPFVVLCQLNRGPEIRDNHRPRLSDLRDSGSIEQDADQIWFLYRDSYYTPVSGISEAEIIVAKNRNGPQGVAHTWWNPDLISFREPNILEDF